MKGVGGQESGVRVHRQEMTETNELELSDPETRNSER